jgi:hypothetical protein
LFESIRQSLIDHYLEHRGFVPLGSILADLWVTRISEVADLAQMRKKAHVLPSHWWWYLDEIIMRKQEALG